MKSINWKMTILRTTSCLAFLLLACLAPDRAAFAQSSSATSISFQGALNGADGKSLTSGAYNLTFFKEGFATVGEYLMLARDAETAAGGPQSPAGRAAFNRTLVNLFNQTYASAGGFWTAAPSKSPQSNRAIPSVSWRMSTITSVMPGARSQNSCGRFPHRGRRH